MSRVYNFAPGPAAMPLPALERASSELTEFGGAGMSVMEMSHRSKMYLEIFERVKARFNQLMGVPDGYTTLLLQGGATAQFSAAPLNLLGENDQAAYADSGNFAHGAITEARKYGKVVIAGDSSADKYTYIPAIDQTKLTGCKYLHITTNNTVYGTRWPQLPETVDDVPLVADMSSNILGEPYDVRRFGVIYAGAQKNIGPAGLTVVIVRDDLLGKARPSCPKVMNWKAQADSDSMLNTPPCYAIYLAGLCLDWLDAQGGVAGIDPVNAEKARMLYEAVDESGLFANPVKPSDRSRMNVVFTTGDPDKDESFRKEAARAGLVNLKGHRAVGGMRASIYNAMPVEGVAALVAFMRKFERG
ncbi:MAG: 3-phosphoserine/phosphohydroxythreonine transaminase [Oscillospiraceae bacterium]|jgi:phosphoserine aminotransferase|nr:3-phosphoserine/phosphohydroxythreonine transaminase [Oscillospiraceae bacterium]